MGTSKRFKPINPCIKCGKNMVNLSRDEQDEHEQYHINKEIEDKKQTKIL